MNYKFSDVVVAKFARHQHDLMQRVLEGSVDPDAVTAAVQKVIDANDSMFNPVNYFQDGEHLIVHESVIDAMESGAIVKSPKNSLSTIIPVIADRANTIRALINRICGDVENCKKSYNFNSYKIWELLSAQLDGSEGELLLDHPNILVCPNFSRIGHHQFGEQEEIYGHRICLLFISWSKSDKKWIMSWLYRYSHQCKPGTKVFFNKLN